MTQCGARAFSYSLLLSSSRVHGYGYLEFVRDELVTFLAGYTAKPSAEDGDQGA